MDKYAVGKNELSVLSWEGVGDIFQGKQGEEDCRQYGWSCPSLFFFLFLVKREHSVGV